MLGLNDFKPQGTTGTGSTTTVFAAISFFDAYNSNAKIS